MFLFQLLLSKATRNVWNHLSKDAFSYISCFVLAEVDLYMHLLVDSLVPMQAFPLSIFACAYWEESKIGHWRGPGNNCMVYCQCMRGLQPSPTSQLTCVYLQHVSMVYIGFSSLNAVFDYAPCFQDGWNEAIQIPTTTVQDMADLPPEHTFIRRHCMQSLWHCPHSQKGPGPSLKSHSTPQSHPTCQVVIENFAFCKAIKEVDGGKTWKRSYLLSWKQDVHHPPIITACMLFQSQGAM